MLHYGIGGNQKVDYPNNPTIERKIKFKGEIPFDDYWDLETRIFPRI